MAVSVGGVGKVGHSRSGTSLTLTEEGVCGRDCSVGRLGVEADDFVSQERCYYREGFGGGVWQGLWRPGLHHHQPCELVRVMFPVYC
jgi:hypothetical protein